MIRSSCASLATGDINVMLDGLYLATITQIVCKQGRPKAQHAEQPLSDSHTSKSSLPKMLNWFRSQFNKYYQKKKSAWLTREKYF